MQTAKDVNANEIGRTHLVLVDKRYVANATCTTCALVFRLHFRTNICIISHALHHFIHFILNSTRRSRRDANAWSGRSDTNKRVVFDDILMKVADDAAASSSSTPTFASANLGNYVAVRIDSSNGITLRGSKSPYTLINLSSQSSPSNPAFICFLISLGFYLFSHFSRLQPLLPCCRRVRPCCIPPEAFCHPRIPTVQTSAHTRASTPLFCK
jgi:hypothetical protein